VRRGREARERRRQAAQARQAASQALPEPPKPCRLPVPGSTAEALELAAELGWNAERRKDGFRLTHPSGATAMLHLTLSDKSAWRNIRADLLRPTRSEKAS